MESRWYLLPGQTIENTKISERGHALHITNTAWKKITGHLDRKKNIEDAIEEERAHRQALKEGSDAMTKNWPDSIEHVHLHKEMERKKQAEELDRKRMENYHVLRQEQADIKDAYMKRVHQTMFYQKCYPKNVNGALMFSEALYERGKQIEFQKMIDKHYEEEERKYAEKVRQGAIDEKRENEEKAQSIRKKQTDLSKLYIKQIKEKEECERKSKEARIKQELADNENARKEMELERKIRIEEIIKERADRKREVEEYLTEANEFKRQLAKEDEEVEEVIQVFEKAKHEIECIRQEKLREFRQQELARREAASKGAVAEAKAKDEAFEKSIKQAIAEADAREEAKERERVEKRARLRKDREEDRKNYLERKAEQDRMELEEKKWKMLNRLKADEAMKAYDQQRAEENWENSLKQRDEILKQIAEDKARKESSDDQKAIDEFIMKKLKADDDEFFKYAEHVIEFARSRGRTTRPMEMVVEDYKKENNLIPPGHKPVKICKNDDGTSTVGNVKMVNVKPGKMAHHPREDPNYRRCPCHKDELLK